MFNLIQHLICTYISYSTACENTIFPLSSNIKQHPKRKPFFRTRTNPLEINPATFQWLQLLLHHLQTGLARRDDESLRHGERWKPWKLKSLTSRLPTQELQALSNLMANHSVVFFYNIFLLKLKKYKYIYIYNFKCWVNLETFLKHVDLTSGHPWLALTGCYIFRNSSTNGTPSNRPPVEHHCVHWWLLLLERQGLVQWYSFHGKHPHNKCCFL